MEKILIVAPEDELHAAVVAWALRECGFVVDLWDTSNVLDNGGCSVRFGNKLSSGVTISKNSGYTSGWVKRVPNPETFSSKVNNDDKEFISRQHSNIVENILYLMPENDMFWINRFDRVLRAERKMLQHDACSRLGIKCPETLISNDPSQIRDFCKEYGSIVAKPIDVYTWEEGDGGLLMTYASTITERDLSLIDDAQIEMCPTIYQQLIAKQLDLRIVYVDGKVFGCSIFNPNKNSIDFRRHQEDGTLIYNYYEVPAAIASQITQLCEFFGIQYASSDFCLDENGDPIFLDLNPGGASLFVEYYGEGKNNIVQELCSLLTRVPARKFGTFSDYSNKL